MESPRAWHCHALQRWARLRPNILPIIYHMVMNSLSIGTYQKAAIKIWVIASVLLTIGLVAIADSRNDSAIQLTDYVSAFYLAGKIVNQDNPVSLYPQPSDVSLRGAPFDVLGHKYLPA